MEYSIEVYKQDRRKKTGERLVEKRDLGDISENEAVNTVIALNNQGLRVELHETYVTKRSAMAPFKEFQERYDTPYYCSPSSETYWCM